MNWQVREDFFFESVAVATGQYENDERTDMGGMLN